MKLTTRVCGGLTASCVLAAALALAPAAAGKGKTNKLAGEFDGDPGSKVSMKVKVRGNGTPKQVKKFTYRNLDANCFTTTPEVRETSGKVPGKINVARSTGTPLFTKTIGANAKSVTGTLMNKGKKALGTLLVQYTDDDGVDCVANGTFTAKKKKKRKSAALAVAKTRKLSGSTESQVTGFPQPDPNSKVSMKVKVNKKGKPTKVMKVKYKNLDVLCDDGRRPGEQSGKLPGKLKVDRDAAGGLFQKSAGNDPRKVVTGRVNKKGRKATGTVAVIYELDGTSCMAVGSFTAKKK